MNNFLEKREEDDDLFSQICEKVKINRCQKGIGTLSEKTIHAVIKEYIVPRPEYHEIKYKGFVADIMFENEIYEIQSRNFGLLKRKLEVFLVENQVTIILPIIKNKKIIWYDQNNNIIRKRVSPLKGNYYDAFEELYKIKKYLNKENLYFRFIIRVNTNKFVMKSLKELTIGICNDHAGVELKNILIEQLKSKVKNVVNFGTDSSSSVDYPDFAHLLGYAMDKGEYNLGFVFCGSANGVNMTVNKHQGVRSGLCWNEEIAVLTKAHNNANVCAIPARFISATEALKIVNAFIKT